MIHHESLFGSKGSRYVKAIAAVQEDGIGKHPAGSQSGLFSGICRDFPASRAMVADRAIPFILCLKAKAQGVPQAQKEDVDFNLVALILCTLSPT